MSRTKALAAPGGNSSGFCGERSSHVHARVVHMLACSGDVDLDTAEAMGSAGRILRRHPAAAIPHVIFPCCPRALSSIFEEIGIGDHGLDPRSCGGEFGASLEEVRRGAVFLNPPMRRRIETACPAPLVDINRDASALADRAEARRNATCSLPKCTIGSITILPPARFERLPTV
jgi:hypothetical protein